MTPNLTPTQLRDPTIMHETLRAAYQFTLDTSDHMCGGTFRRLLPEDERELGRRLAFYWTDKP